MVDPSLRVVTASLKRRSQDAWGVARRDDGTVCAAWVIDGATPLEAPDPRAAAEQVSCFAWALSAALGEAAAGIAAGTAAGSPAAAPLEAPVGAAELASVVEAARRRAAEAVLARWPPLQGSRGMPTATLSLVRRTGEGLETYVLGDSPLWVEAGDGEPLSLEDPQFHGAEQRLVRHWHRLRRRGLGARDAYDRLRADQAGGRALRNSPQGLWILGDSPQAAAHGQRRLLPGAQPRRVCLLTDGLERAVAPFGLLGRAQLFEAVCDGRALATIQALRTAERADGRCLAHPRLSAHDDLTAVAAVI